MSIAIQVSGLKKYYGSLKAVDDVSFSVESGTIFGMLGPNGAGKSTTIETLVGLNKRNGGEVTVLGLDPEFNLQELKLRMGVQLQNPSLFPRLTVYEIVKLFARMYPNPLPIGEVIAQVGLSEKVKVQTKALSGGQRHRLAIALAMVSNGEIIFLDEPTTGLDPQARRQLWDLILQLKSRGVTIFLSTHYMEEAEKLCDKLVIIDYGKIIAEGSPSKLINQFFQDQAIEFSDPGFTESEKEEILQLKIAKRLSSEEDKNQIILYTEELSQTLTRLLDYAVQINKPLADLTVRKATLEDVFLKLTGRGIRQ